MLSSSLRRYICHRAFQNFKQRLLYSLSGNVPRDGNIFSFLGDFVYFVDVHNAALRSFQIVIRVLYQLQQDVFHILADIARFRQRRGVRHRKGYVENTRKRLCQQSFSAAGRSEHENIALFKLHAVVFRLVFGGIHSLIMIVNRNRQRFLALSCPTTYLSSCSLISLGVGSTIFSVFSSMFWSSSIALQISIQTSQIAASLGLAIILLTSDFLRPQNEQRCSLFSDTLKSIYSVNPFSNKISCRLCRMPWPLRRTYKNLCPCPF